MDVEGKDNYVKTEDNTDYAYMAVSGSVISGDSGNNKVRSVREYLLSIPMIILSL